MGRAGILFSTDHPIQRVDWTLVGLLAGALTSTALVPQLVRGYRTRKLDDVSPWMLVAMLLGVALWLAYGLARRDTALVAANAIALVFTASLLGLWVRYGRRPRQPTVAVAGGPPGAEPSAGQGAGTV